MKITKNKIVILGGSGFLGTKLKEILSKEYEIVSASKSGKQGVIVDATNLQELKDFLNKEKPEVIIDCIALTSSLTCEKNPELAMSLNYQTAKNIKEIAKEIDATMIFISSSYVFDGEKGDYEETDSPKPLNQYGITKVMAENEVLKLKKGIVLRVDLMYGFNSRNSKNGFFDKIISGENIEISDPNQTRQPVFVNDVAKFIEFILNKKEYGIFNVANPNKIKMIDFLKKIESIVRTDSKIKVVPKKLEVSHPKNATLNINKIKNMGFETKNINSSLKILKDTIKL